MPFPLASSSWIDDSPQGVRLRWRFPFAALGLPRLLAIERAPVDARGEQPGRGMSPSDLAPFAWWDDHGQVDLAGLPVLEHRFADPVDAVSFVLATADCFMRVLAEDGAGGTRVVEERLIHGGDAVRIDRGRTHALQFLAFAVRLDELRTLDLARGRPLDWQRIAELRVRDALQAPYAEVEPRVPAATLGADAWDELRDVAATAHAGPSAWPPGEPPPWQAIDAALGVRWEYAVLAGAGFVDGPEHSTSPHDDVDAAALLDAPASMLMAYRTVEEHADGRAPERSILALSPSGVAPPLLAPTAPAYSGGVVRLQDDGTFEASVTARWRHADPSAVGVVLEEQVSASPARGTPAAVTDVECRSRRPEDPPGEGVLQRVRAVPFHDVDLSARARAVDGWDRTSGPSAPAAPAPLTLFHAPTPPVLATARVTGGQIRLDVAPPAPGASVWEPDEIVQRAAGELVVYRRVRGPVRADVTVSSPQPAGARYDVSVSGIPTGADFTGGQLLVGGVSFTVLAQAPGRLTVAAPFSGGAAPCFWPGSAKLVEDHAGAALWTPVHAQPATGFAGWLVFTEPLAWPTAAAQVLTYALRVRFLGRVGPLGNVVSVHRVPHAPAQPPLFTVSFLSVDHYRRTLVEIALTDPSSEAHVVAWAPGALAGDAFAALAAEGDVGAQSAHGGHLLHDVLSLPVPQNVAQRVTVGVAQVGAAGTRSPYRTLSVDVPARSSP